MARLFSSTTDRVSYASDAALNVTGALSLYCFVYFQGKGYNQILSKMATNRGTDAPFNLRTETGGSWKLVLLRAGASSGLERTSTAAVAEGWHFIAITHDTATVKFYIDGVEDSTQAMSIAASTTTDPVTIGEGSGNLGGKCRIAFPGVHNVVLTPTELETIRTTILTDHASAVTTPPVTRGLVLYAPLQGASPETDLSSGARSGTVTGSIVVDDPGVVGVYDEYGGLNALDVPGGATGFFRVALWNNRWLFATPNGKAFWFRGHFNAALATGYTTAVIAKYGDLGDMTTWAAQQHRRMLEWGFNAVGDYSDNRMWGSLPLMFLLKIAPYAVINQGALAPGPTKNAISDMLGSTMISDYGLFVGGGCIDVFDPDWGTYLDAFVAADVAGLHVLYGDPRFIGIGCDDRDYLLGFGPNATHWNLAWSNLIGRPFIAGFSHPEFDGKYALRDFLAVRYGAPETLTGTLSTSGTAVTFSSGTSGASSGDFLVITSGAQSGERRRLVTVSGMSGTLDRPFYENVAGGSTAQFVPFAAALADLNTEWGSSYTNWGTNGTWVETRTDPGTYFLDENGATDGAGNPLHSWMPFDVLSLTDCTAAMRQDLNDFLYLIGKRYYQRYKAAYLLDIATVAAARGDAPYPHLFGSVVSLGSVSFPTQLGQPPLLVAAGEECDVLNMSLPAGQAGIDEVVASTGDIPMITWEGSFANPDSPHSSNPDAIDNVYSFSTQEARGAAYASNLLDRFDKHATGSGTRVIVGIKWWEFHDSIPENRNWGWVTLTDNAYDGQEAIVAAGSDALGYPTGGESADYGDFITQAAAANTSIDALLLSELGSGPHPVGAITRLGPHGVSMRRLDAGLLTVEPGAIGIAGTAVGLFVGRRLTSDPGAIALTGTDVALVYSAAPSGGFPDLHATTSGGATVVNSPNLILANPAGSMAGDRAVHVIGVDGSSTFTAPTGWTLGASVLSATSVRLVILYRILTGGVDDTVDGSAGHGAGAITPTDQMYSYVGHRFLAGTFDAATAPHIVTAARPTGLTSDCPAATAPWGSANNHFLAGAVFDGGNRTVGDTAPTNYTAVRAEGGGGSNQSTITITAERDFTSATDDPDTVAIVGGNQLSVAFTIVTKPGSAAGAYTLTADPGAVGIAGTDVTLTYVPVGAHILTVDPGSVAIAGTAVTPRATRVMTVDQGAVGITGLIVDLAHGALTDYVLTVEPGALPITGTVVDLNAPADAPTPLIEITLTGGGRRVALFSGVPTMIDLVGGSGAPEILP